MSNPEFPTFNATLTSDGEFISETPRQVSQERGQKGNEQVYIENLLAKRDELLARRKEAMALREQLSNEVEQEENTATVANSEPVNLDPEQEQPSQEEIAETIAKTKKNRGIKKLLMNVATIALTVIMATSGIVTGQTLDRPDNSASSGYSTGVEAEELNNLGNDHESNEKESGIYDGYNEKGMWSSKDKGGAYDFASAKEVAEVCDNDECEMVKYTARNQVESYADYLANLPEKLQPEGFKGLTILETEKKLESLSDEEFDSIKQQFDDIIDGAFTRRVVVNGEQNNAYMRLKNAGGKTTHGNMELVSCTTNEDNLEVTQLYWMDKDGNEVGSMTIKMLPVYDNNGNISGFGGCMQVISGDQRVYNGLTKITENTPTTPTNPPETTPPPTTTPPETTPPPTTTPPETNPPKETTPPETTPPETTPPETVKPKDADNLTRIDDQILDDVAEDVGSEEVKVTPNPGVSKDDLTDKPSSDSYEDTEATTVQNETSKQAEPVQEQVSPENDYSQDRGGAHSDEYAPVQEDQAAQDAADAAETPVEEAPTGGTELQDILGELGIN